MLSSSPLLNGKDKGGRTATIPRVLTYPKILSEPKKEERKGENGGSAWCRSSLSQAWAAEIATLGQNIWWPNQEMLQRLDRPNT